MSEDHVDFAIVGNTPLARLVAGLLRSVHGKSVALQCESQSAYRLARGLDLSVGVITRPQSWALLGMLVPETLKLIGRIAGRRTWSRVDPIFFAEGMAGKETIAHLRHMAGAFGIAAERVRQRELGTGRDGVILRDAVLLSRTILEPALDAWLMELGVIRLDHFSDLSIAADGSASISRATGHLTATQTVLADDAALLRYLGPLGWPALLGREAATTLLTQPAPPLAAPIMHMLDRRLTLSQPGRGGITATSPGGFDAVFPLVRDLMGSERGFRLAGQSVHDRITTADGAPAVGRLNGSGADIVAGFGSVGVFFAIALARWLCGAAGSDEQAWFDQRLIGRDAPGSLVAEAGGPA